MIKNQLAILVPRKKQNAKMLTGVYGTLSDERPRNADGSYNFIVDSALAESSTLLTMFTERGVLRVDENDLVVMDGIVDRDLAAIKATFASALKHSWKSQYDNLIASLEDGLELKERLTQEKGQVLSAIEKIILTSGAKKEDYTVLLLVGAVNGDLLDTTIVPYQDESDYAPIKESEAVDFKTLSTSLGNYEGLESELARYEGSDDYSISNIDPEAKAFVYFFGYHSVYVDPSIYGEDEFFGFRYQVAKLSPALFEFMVQNNGRSFNPRGVSVTLGEAAHMTEMDSSDLLLSQFLKRADQSQYEAKKLMEQLTKR